MDWSVKYYPMQYGGVKQVYPNIPAGSPIYAQSVVLGNLVFLSSMNPRDPKTGKVTAKTLEDQIFVVLEKMRLAMEAAGSSINNIVKTIMILKDVKNYYQMRKIEVEYYLKYAMQLVTEPPASTFVQAAALADSDYLVEIDAIGVIDRKKKGWEVVMHPEYQAGKKLVYPDVPADHPKFSQSAAVGNLLLVSGCTGRDPKTGTVTSNTFEGQIDVAFNRIKGGMETAGSSMNNLVRTLMMNMGLEYYPRMRKVEVEFYQKHAPQLVKEPPASTFFIPGSLRSPEYLIEIDSVGVISRNKPDWKVKYYPEIWAGKELSYPNVPAESPKFSRTTVVGNIVFVSGCQAMNTKTMKTETSDFTRQTIICLDKVKAGLEEVGSSMNNIVKTFILVTDAANHKAFRKVELEYYQKYAPQLVKEPPASTFIAASSLARPEFLVEIDVIAAVSR